MKQALLIHGNDLCGEFYQPLAAQLAARGVTTTLITLPGFYREPPLDEPEWPALVDRVLQRFGGGALIGHSLGGMFALLAAARRPPGLSALVLLEPTIPPWQWLARRSMRRYQREVVHADRGRFDNWTGTFRRVHDLERYPRAAIDLYLECRKHADVHTTAALIDQMPALYPLPFQQVQAPSLVVCGARSGVRARLLARSVAKRLGASRALIAGAGHWLANEQDSAIAERIAAFLP